MTTPEWHDGGHGRTYRPDDPPAWPEYTPHTAGQTAGYPAHAPEYAPEHAAAYAQPLPAEQYLTPGAAYPQQTRPAQEAHVSAPAPAPAAEPAPAATRRTGSPIIAPGIQPAALTAVLAALTAAAAALGRPALAVPAVLLQALTAAGWFRLNGMWPARQGIALAFLSGLAVDAGLFATDGRHAPLVAAGALGVWLPLVLVQQLRHHGSPDERLASLTATAAATALTVLAGGYLALAGTAAGHEPVVAGALGVAAATLLRALPLPPVLSVPVALLAGAGGGAAATALTGLPTLPAVLLGLAAGVCALVGLRVASYDWPSRFVHFTAGVALPLTVAAPVVYLLGQVLA